MQIMHSRKKSLRNNNQKKEREKYIYIYNQNTSVTEGTGFWEQATPQ